MEKILKYISDGATILTPNRRLSAWISKAYNTHMSTQGQMAWLQPQILPINTWLNLLWEDYNQSGVDAPMLLNPSQENFLWENIIENDESHQILQTTSTADLAKTARQLVKQWQVDIEHPLFSTTEDYRTFIRWNASFEQHCRAGNWIDPVSMTDEIINQLRDGVIQTPKSIVFCGFNEFAPQIDTLIELLREANTATIEHNISNNHICAHHAELSTLDEEIEAAAKWAKKHHIKNTSHTIGIVIPNLDKKSHHVNRIFSDVFNHNHQFNITAGAQLTTYPIINTGFQVLSLHKERISRETLCEILLSPFIGDAEKERSYRYKLDAALRRRNIDQVATKDLFQPSSLLHSLISNQCKKLSSRLIKFHEHLSELQAKDSYSGWASQFSKLLHIIGWPGERSVNSEEHQTLDRWKDLLNQLSSMDYVCESVTLSKALSTLKMLASKQLFQPKSPDANVQIMGLLEAASIPFHHLWVSGLNDTVWPPQPSPNPFIPNKLQRELKMPHATSDRELLYCETMMNQFLASSQHIIFSYAKNIENVEMTPSPIIRRYPHAHDLALPSYTPTNHRIRHHAELTHYIDQTGPSITDNENIKGGVSLIKDYALCPFKSFSTWRLHAHALEDPVPGLNKRERGKITHKIFELFWEKVQSQNALNTLSENELNSVVNDCVTTALNEDPSYKYYGNNYFTLEKKRLIKLAIEWLYVEKSRPEFSVSSIESAESISLGPLTISCRIDRIDTLKDNTRLIIDYKTSNQLNINDWLGERPAEPQLPIYATKHEDISGIAYAQLAPSNITYVGIASDDINIQGIKSIEKVKKAEACWHGQTEYWRDNLTAIANHISNGDATVNPKDGLATCKWCNLNSLCRYYEINGLISNDE